MFKWLKWFKRKKVAGTARKYEVLCIIKVPNGNYYVATFDRTPLWHEWTAQDEPVPTFELMTFWYTYEMHSFEEAREYLLKHVLTRLTIANGNVISDIAIDVKEPLCVLPVRNWIKDQIPLKEALGLKQAA